jgi:uncharacterized protein YdhG (YjbR/CyaY superfamily)
MPDAQGTASVIGEFLKGYMAETARMEQKKYADLARTLSIAEKYEKMASDPTIDKAEQDHWKQFQIKALADADKIMNRKSSGLGQIMKLFGFGKKQQNGSVATPPSEWYQPIDSNKTPAPMPRPGFMGPEPQIDAPNTPAEFRFPMSQYINAPGGGTAPVAPVATATKPPDDPYAGMNRIMAYNERVKDLESRRNLQNAIEVATRTGEISQRFANERADAEQARRQEEIQRQLTAYRSNPSYGQDPTFDRQMESIIQFGQAPREPALRTKTEIVPNAANQLVRRTTDLNTGTVISEEPYANPNDEPMIQALIDSGNARTREEAVAKLGQIRLTGLDLANKGKTASIANQEELRKYREERTKILADKKSNNGTMTTAQAIALYEKAQNYGRAMLRTTATDIDLMEMPEDEKTAKIAAYARQYVEGTEGQEGIMRWDDLLRIANPNGRNPEEEARGYRGPQTPGRRLMPPK